MPPLPPAPNVLKVVLSGTNADTKWANVLHFGWGGTTPSSATLDSLAATVVTAYGTHLKQIFPSSVELTLVEVLDLTSSTAASGASAASESGTGTGATVTSQCSALIHHTVTRRYRGGHPRTYLCAPAGSFLSLPDQILTTGVTAISSFWASFIGDILAFSTGGLIVQNFVSLSYFTGHALRPSPVQDIIIGSECDARLATQRRRIGR